MPSLEALEAQLRPSFVEKPGEPPRKQVQQARTEGRQPAVMERQSQGFFEQGVNLLERAVARDLDGDGDVGQVGYAVELRRDRTIFLVYPAPLVSLKRKPASITPLHSLSAPSLSPSGGALTAIAVARRATRAATARELV